MPNLNKVFLMGNLTADPEVRYTPKGTAVTDIRLAINRYVAGGAAGAAEQTDRQEETTFVDITLWNRQAEITANYLTKGSGVFIEGRLQLDSWEDKQTGQKRTKLRVIGENVQFLPRGGGNEGGQARSAGSAPRNNNYQRPAAQGYGQAPAGDTFNAPSAPPADNFADDDIPF
ncbi:MAG: single-stranded DNA-binding protein [Akkermansia sp.]